MKKFPLFLSAIVFVFAGCSLMIDDFKNMKAGTAYVVNHNFESIETEGLYDYEDLYVKETLYGPTDSLTQAQAKEVEGFTAQPFEQSEIAIDGSTVININYKRNYVTLQIAPKGNADGKWSSDELYGENASTDNIIEYTLRYGTPFPVSSLSSSENYIGEPLPANTDEYAFVGWEPAFPQTVPAENTVYTAKYSRDFVSYTVNYYFENLNSEDSADYSNYTMDSAKSVTLKAESGKSTDAPLLSAVDTVGFTALPVENQLADVNSSEALVINVYYKRNIITLTFDDGEADSWSAVKTVRGKYGTSLSADLIPSTDDISRPYYDLSGWDKEIPSTFLADDTFTMTYSKKYYTYTFNAGLGHFANGENTASITMQWGSLITEAIRDSLQPVREGDEGYVYTGWVTAAGVKFTDLTEIGTEDLSFTTLWSSEKANYTVSYYFQNINNDSYTEDTSLGKTVMGVIGAETAVTADVVTGFDLVPYSQQIIKEDSSTHVKVYYNRKTITLTFDDGEGDWSSAKTVSGRYGAATSLPEDPVRSDYSFEGWTPEVPSVFPAEDASFTAEWTKVLAKYTIRYYFEDASGMLKEDSSLAKTEKGTIGQTTNVSAQTFDWYEVGSVNNTTILEDDSALVKVNYLRKQYTYTFNPDGGKINGSSSNVTVTGRWGSGVTRPSDPVKTDWNFKGWDSEVPSVFGKENLTFTAQWVSAESIDGLTFSGSEDISLNVSGSVVSVSVPDTSRSWTFTWYVNGTMFAQGSSSSITLTGSGKYEVLVNAKAGNESYTESVVVEIE